VNVVWLAVAVNSVTVLYAVVVTLDAGIPRYLADMLPVPVGGAAENVSVVPDTEYVLGSCRTPPTATSTDAVLAGATDIVKAVVVPFPLNWSVKNATW
jgi:hypothetical protein